MTLALKRNIRDIVRMFKKITKYDNVYIIDRCIQNTHYKLHDIFHKLFNIPLNIHIYLLLA